MVEFKTKLPKDITAEKIQIHFVPNNWEDPDLDTEQNKLPSNQQVTLVAVQVTTPGPHSRKRVKQRQQFICMG